MKATFFATCLAVLAAPAAYAVDLSPAMRAFFETNVASWSEDPILRDAIASQNSQTANYDLARIEELDLAWRAEIGGGATPTIDSVVLTPASDFLRTRVAASGGTITEVFVMDAQGLNVASSGVTSDYWQGDEDKFQKTYPLGAGALHFSEIEFDESSQSYQAQISVTLTDDAGQAIGAMTIGIIADALM